MAVFPDPYRTTINRHTMPRQHRLDCRGVALRQPKQHLLRLVVLTVESEKFRKHGL
jgi:hypothetical protein